MAPEPFFWISKNYEMQNYKNPFLKRKKKLFQVWFQPSKLSIYRSLFSGSVKVYQTRGSVGISGSWF